MANKSNDYIRLDLNSGRLVKQIYVRQGDTVARTICATVTNEGKVVSLEGALIVEIFIVKADGYEADNGCVVVGNEIQYTLRTSDISAIGENVAQFRVTYENGEVMTTPSFLIQVYKKELSDKTQKSTNEYTALTQQLVLATEAAKESVALRDETKASAKEASDYSSMAGEYAATAQSAARESEGFAQDSNNYAYNSNQSAREASGYANNASESATEASGYADSAEDFYDKVEVKASEIIAAENQAAISAGHAASSAVESEDFANRAEINKNTASQAAIDATLSATQAADYEASAKTYYEQTKAIKDSIAGAVVPKGTKRFNELSLADTEVGWMYNMAEDFTTTSDFEEGAGIEIARGTNIYKTVNEKWDVMAAGAIIVVDDELSDTSENPVQNKVIKEALDNFSSDEFLDTKAEWEELPDTKLTDDKHYIIDEDDEDVAFLTAMHKEIEDNAAAIELLEADVEEHSEAIEKINNDLVNKFTYSTEEKVIGKWIDGRDIYRRTFFDNTAHSASGNLQSFSIGNLGFTNFHVVKVEGAFQNTDDDNWFPISYSLASLSQSVGCVVSRDGLIVLNYQSIGMKNISVHVDYFKN